MRGIFSSTNATSESPLSINGTTVVVVDIVEGLVIVNERLDKLLRTANDIYVSIGIHLYILIIVKLSLTV
jgi:hypothetical protein